MLTILLYALTIAIAATAISTILTQPDKPLHIWLKWLEDSYAYQVTTLTNPDETTQTSGKIDRTKPASFAPQTARTQLTVLPTFWVYQMFAACNVCFSGQMAFWFFGISYAQQPIAAAVFALVFGLFVASALVAKSRLLCAFFFAVNIAANGWFLGWHNLLHLPVLVACTIYFAAVAETIYTRFLISR